MKYFMLCSIISMNLFIVVSTLFSQVFHLNIIMLYYPVMILVTVGTIGYCIFNILLSKKLPIGVIVLLTISILILIAYFVSPHNSERLSKNTIRFFILWCVSASIAGIYIKSISRKKVESFFKIIFIIFSMTFLFVILIPYLLGKLPTPVVFGLMNYQNASYISAFTVGLGCYLILKGDLKHRNFYVFMTIITFPSVFIPGGRGGAILLILYSLLTIVLITFKRNISFYLKIAIYTVAFLASAALLIFVSNGDNRTFSYIKNGSFDINGTSGRGPIYEMSLHYISEKPLIGYGPFNYYHLIDNIPHNIVLEMLLSYGFLGLIILVFLIILVLIKFFTHYDKNSIDLLVVFITIYPITMLMFSTNYLVVGELWFAVFYFLTKERNQNV
ncbi:O-antigen ligase family protein [Staphylococcus pragensis]|uniref:O-antigen ligase family protein n=1 Tax=Staphylococcus pragensis TaxID=1611836 RepID=A0A4Z1B2F4_9STAP|nr:MULTISPECIES: O-antigen ligase family protein [Staphylococcus]RTX89669.1 O-antigen ligase family protein [Staphylococcus carnosus]TGN24656.1 O-antigen ligase family protein [Staphylococcus pragensis]GGG95863.1 capsular polysaccharide biosynthesis protein [Staphylococcus pragensis]